MTAEQLTALYQSTGTGLFGYAAALLSDAAEAEDVVQEAFARLWGRTRWGFAPSCPESYLLRAVRNIAFGRLRRRLLFARRHRQCAWLEPLQPDETLAQQGDTLTAALEQVPPKQREVVVLKIFNGMTFDHIGHVLAISPATAASRYRYALEKLRSLLKEEDLR